jgi:hypothetical protein
MGWQNGLSLLKEPHTIKNMAKVARLINTSSHKNYTLPAPKEAHIGG